MAHPFLDKIQALASLAAKAGFNLGTGVAPTSPVNGDIWNTAAAIFGRTNGVTVQLGPALGSKFDAFTITTGQTTATLTYTPASLADLEGWIDTKLQDPANFTGLAAKVVTFTAMPASANGKTLRIRYTRLD